jgi:REP element-mobilizing transposase RayT
MDLPRRHRVRYEVAGHARLLTCSTYHRAPIFALAWCADIFADHLEQARAALGFRLTAWVCMPDHFHLLVQPQDDSTPVSEILQRIKEPVARAITKRLRASDDPLLDSLSDGDVVRVWQRGGGHDRNITTREAMALSAAYIHANPVRRELCSQPEDWVWSSARWYTGDRAGPVKIEAAR